LPWLFHSSISSVSFLYIAELYDERDDLNCPFICNNIPAAPACALYLSQWFILRIKKENSDLQNTTQKTKYRATRTLLKTGSDLRCSGRVGVPVPLVASVVLF
jgi:hypothetical protein